MTETADLTTAIEAVVAELEALTAPGTVIAVVVDEPGQGGYLVGSPRDQNPAATYGALHGAHARYRHALSWLK